MYVRGLQCFMWGGIMYSAFCYSNEVPDEISLQEKLVKKCELFIHRFGAFRPRSGGLWSTDGCAMLKVRNTWQRKLTS